MTRRDNNVYEFDPKRRRRSKTRFDGDRLRLDRKKKDKPGGSYKDFENLVRNRRLKAFAIFFVFVLAYVLARPVISSLTLGR